jgi:hypothetical protein
MVAVALTTDSEFMRQISRRLGSSTKRTYRVVTTAEAVAQVKRCAPLPVCVIVDAADLRSGPGASIRALKAASPKGCVIVATDERPTRAIAEAWGHGGADAVVAKDDVEEIERIVLALRRRRASGTVQ